MNNHLYKTSTTKASEHFARDFMNIAGSYGFTVANEETMNMAKTFSAHGASVADDFDLHMIQVCKPDKAAGSLHQKPRTRYPDAEIRHGFQRRQ